MKQELKQLASLLSLLLTLSACGQQPILPDLRLTPGDTIPGVDPQQLCVRGYSRTVRDVPLELKHQVYAAYGILWHKPGDYELDHLIPLSLGGSNSIRNLWPESTKTIPFNAYVKDELELKLHELVCAGQLDLKTAQHEIATDWIAAYKKYVGPDPQSVAAARADALAPASNTDVWVNTRSGKFWRPGTRYYGRTHEGAYMPEADAVAHGYRAAGGQ